MELQGKCIKILETQRFVSQKSGQEYIKNFFVIETSGQYPKKVSFSVMGSEKFAQMGIRVGATYNVSFDIESREYKERWYTELSAWKAIAIDGVQQTTQQEVVNQTQVQAQAPSATTQQPSTVATADPVRNGDGSDNLPF